MIAPILPQRENNTCLYFGAATGATVRCPSCRGHVEVKLYECAIYQQCTLARKVAATACCRGCRDYRAREEERSAQRQ